MISRTVVGGVTFTLYAALLPALSAPGTVAADEIPVAAFAKKPVFTDLKLSPDGRYVAALVPTRRHSSVVVMEVAGLKPISRLQLDPDDHVLQFWWAGDDQIVASLGYQSGPLDPPAPTGELVAINADGKNFRYLFGARHVRYASIRTGQTASAWMVDPRPNDPDHIVIGVHEWVGSGNHEYAEDLNIKNGHATVIARSPEISTDTDFVVDPNGAVRYAVTTSGAFEQKTWQRSDTGEWKRLETAGASPPVPLGFSRDGGSVYLRSREFGPRSCLVQHILATGERRKLACDDNSDLDEAVFSFEQYGEPIAAIFSAGQPETRVLDGRSPDRELLTELMAAFPGEHVVPT